MWDKRRHADAQPLSDIVGTTQGRAEDTWRFQVQLARSSSAETVQELVPEKPPELWNFREGLACGVNKGAERDPGQRSLLLRSSSRSSSSNLGILALRLNQAC